MRLPALVAFDAVTRHLNFGRAAAELGITATAVSRTIKQLEEEVGARLFNRTTRSVALSEAGAQLHASLGPALEQVRQSLGVVASSSRKPAGTLRVNMSYVAHASLLADHLAEFVARYPDVILEVALDNTLTDIVAAGFDAGIRLGHAVHRDMVALPVGPPQRRVVVASPGYWRARSIPTRPEDLIRHPCIRQRLSGRARFFEWSFRVRHRDVAIDVQGPLVFDEMRAVVEAACQGCGVAYVFRQFAARAIAAGTLVPVLERFSPPAEAFYLYYPSRVMMPGKLRAFVDFLRDANRV